MKMKTKFFKRMLGMVLALAMVLGMIPTVAFATGSANFKDVKEGDWFNEAVEYVTAEGLMVGVGGNKFDPNGQTTRAMVVTVLHRIEGAPTTSSAGFDDVAKSLWYTDAVSWAQANGIVEGYGDGTFRPDKTMTREEMATIFYRYSEYKGYDTTKTKSLSVYSDRRSIQSYAVDAMGWAVAVGLITGFPDGTIRPQDEATRAQLATVLMRFMLLFGNGSNIIVNFDDFFYDRSSGQYFIFERKITLSGSIKNAEAIAKATYIVTDCNGSELLSGEFQAAPSWVIENIAFIVGENNVIISIQYEDGETDSVSFKVNNLCEDNMESLQVDKNDNDGDGVLNYIEVMYHTNPDNNDSDGDGLTDYYEMAVLGTDPTKEDSDGNGTPDNLEDIDSDHITNYDEINLYNTDPLSVDSDGDGLSDSEEIHTHKTSPSNTNTDGDKASDYWEIQNGFDPLTFTDDFGDLLPDDKENTATEDEVEISVVVDDAFLNESTPGYMGVDPYHVALGEAGSSTISIPLDESGLGEEDDPVIYYFNEETQRLEEVPTTITEDGQAVATVDKDGMYILLNRRYVSDVWENDIIPPSDSNVENGTMDIVFVIDRSASMDSNDPNGIRKEVVKEFIRRLRDQDRAAIVQFTSIAETIMPITNDKEALINAVDSIQNSDGGGCAGSDTNAGTNGAAGIRNALDELKESTAAYKYVIFLTDGADTTTPENYTYTDLVNEAVGNVVIHTIGLVGTGDVNTDLLKEIAEATYGNYYLATTGSNAENVPEDVLGLEDVYDDIENITLDRVKDSNNDGITDYYTLLICEGKLVTSKGTLVFGGATYEQVQANADYDNDGLLNGQEVVITESERGVYAKVNAYPFVADSDGDGINDYGELTVYGTNPLRFNEHIDVADVDWVVNSNNFISNKYKELYDSMILGTLEEGSVFIGNAFFGTAYDISILYEYILVSYFEEINKYLVESGELVASIELAKGLTYEVFNAIDEIVEKIIESDENVQDEDDLEHCYSLLENIFSNIPSASNDVASLLQACKGIESSKELAKLIDELIAQAQTLYGSWLNVSNTGFATAADYYKYCDDLFEQYNNTVSHIKNLNIELNITQRIERIGKVTKLVGFAFYVADIAQTGYDSYKECQKLLANISAIENNVYILDIIIQNASNLSADRGYDEGHHLACAAQNIKNKMLSAYNADAEAFEDFFYSYSYMIPVASTAVGEGIHMLIAECGTAGLIVELVRSLGNIAFNIADVATECTKLYAIAATASILSEEYTKYLNSGNGIKANDYWLFYGDNGSYAVSYLKNIFAARITAENQMIAADKANSFLIEWLFANVMYKIDDCESNVNVCKSKLGKY